MKSLYSSRLLYQEFFQKMLKMETPMLAVANLDVSVTDWDFFDHFSNVDDLTVIWAEVSKDHKSLCQGHVCFYNHQHAASAIDAFNWTKLKGRSVIVTPSTFTFNQVTVKSSVCCQSCYCSTKRPIC
ncbi:hypothetical protein POM88_020641 [Heracleum sosnowskyi]|uniref:RRM domain-containing protein n=1 Tax=Heracleum sosnowskyi TaxID=360622 RepID=A0AAD8MRP0_9APIA|nr:hypothetical protein POM88_020641 [Heracleum sosnowskyi]